MVVVVGGLVVVVAGGLVVVVVGGLVVVVAGGLVVVVVGGLVVVVVPTPVSAGLTVATSDHLPQVSLTLPFTWPGAVSKENQ